jgi:hypothetical protein
MTIFPLKVTAGPDGNGHYSGQLCDAEGTALAQSPTLTALRDAGAADVRLAVRDRTGKTGIGALLPDPSAKPDYALPQVQSGKVVFDWLRAS